jgi:hypothetical protein
VKFVSQKLRDAADGEACVRCGNTIGVVGAHYTGARRLAYGGGLGTKVHDFMIAHLCQGCHEHMDRLSREKEKRWEHSEEFLHLIALTLMRLCSRGVLVVRSGRLS